MALSWILVCFMLALVAFVLYTRHELAKTQRAAVELYFVLSFEPLLTEEVYELARQSGLKALTQFLTGIPLTKMLHRILFRSAPHEAWFYHEHLKLLLTLLEHRGLVKITNVPITIAWLEVNQARLWAVPPKQLEYWKSWVYLMERFAQIKNSEESEALYRHYKKQMPVAEMVQKRPWGRRTPPKEVRLTKHAWQNA
jgi:hypothetical protein